MAGRRKLRFSTRVLKRLRSVRLAVCGAAYDGVGVPACIATARLAVAQVQRSLMSRETR